jgi:diguanylate cyclase (GGDEF)-like protein
MGRLRSIELYIAIVTTIILAVLAVAITFILVSLYDVQDRTMLISMAIAINASLMIIFNMLLSVRFMKATKDLKQDLLLKDILYDLFHQTSLKHSIDETCDLILKAAIRAIPYAKRGTIMDVTSPDLVQFKAYEGYSLDQLNGMRLNLKNTYLYKETDGRMDRTIIIPDTVSYIRKQNKLAHIDQIIVEDEETIRSTVCTPILVNGKVFGMLNVDSCKYDAFSQKEVDTLEIFAYEVGRMIRYTQVMNENIYLSRYDDMTKIYNRGYFYELHKKMYADPAIKDYIFIATDLNNLKEVNDTYGHGVGDRLIRHFTKNISNLLTENCVFGRYGGDEFNILLPHWTKNEAYALIEKINEKLANDPIKAGEDIIFVSYSYGVVQCPVDEKDYKELIKLADQKMYAHKREMEALGFRE